MRQSQVVLVDVGGFVVDFVFVVVVVVGVVCRMVVVGVAAS